MTNYAVNVLAKELQTSFGMKRTDALREAHYAVQVFPRQMSAYGVQAVLGQGSQLAPTIREWCEEVLFRLEPVLFSNGGTTEVLQWTLEPGPGMRDFSLGAPDIQLSRSLSDSGMLWLEPVAYLSSTLELDKSEYDDLEEYRLDLDYTLKESPSDSPYGLESSNPVSQSMLVTVHAYDGILNGLVVPYAVQQGYDWRGTNIRVHGISKPNRAARIVKRVNEILAKNPPMV